FSWFDRSGCFQPSGNKLSYVFSHLSLKRFSRFRCAASTITQKIEERFKVNIPIEMLFEGPEINEIAIFIYDQLQRNLTVQKTPKEIGEHFRNNTVNNIQTDGILTGNQVKESVLQEVVQILGEALGSNDIITKEDNLFRSGCHFTYTYDSSTKN
ncbi:hypothetical protein AAHB54_14830, partial [Bacillus cereus]